MSFLILNMAVWFMLSDGAVKDAARRHYCLTAQYRSYRTVTTITVTTDNTVPSAFVLTLFGSCCNNYRNKWNIIILSWYCTDGVPSCSIHAVQQDTQTDLNEYVYSALMLVQHVSDLTVLLDMSSSTRITTYQSLQIQLVQNAPDDGPVRSETCWANIRAE